MNIYLTRYMQKERLTVVGSVVGAITASFCSIGPWVAVLLGAGSLVAASGLERWRPVFLGLTFALLVVAWYLTYRKPNAKGCVEGAACGSRRAGTLNKPALLVATVVSIALAALPIYAGPVARLLQPQISGRARSPGANVATLRVKIGGMQCAVCAVNIQQTLAKEKGVVRVELDFKAKEGVIEYHPARISPDRVVAVINEIGFKAEPLPNKEKP